MSNKRIAELEARIAALEAVLNMGYDGEDGWVGDSFGEAEVKQARTRILPHCEVVRVLGCEPFCGHEWSVWHEADENKEFEEALHVQRACRWCGALETKRQSEVESFHPLPRWSEDYWKWEEDNG